MTEAVTFLSGHRDVIHDSQLDYYVRRLATASADGSICIYDIQGGNNSLSSQITGHQSAVYKVSWSHPKFGSLLASCSYDRKVAIWHEETPGSWSPVYEDESFRSPVVSLVFAPESCGLILAVACTDGTISTYTHNSDNTWLKETFSAHRGGAFAVDWITPNSLNEGETPELGLLSGGFDGVVRFWRYDRSRTGTGTGTTTPSTTLVSTPGVWIEDTNIWHAPYESYIKHMHSDVIRAIAMSPSTTSATVFASCDNHVVKIWSKEEPELPFSVTEFAFGANESVWNISWSLSGLILAVSVGHNTIKFYKQNEGGKWISFEPENFAIPPVQQHQPQIQPQQPIQDQYIQQQSYTQAHQQQSQQYPNNQGPQYANQAQQYNQQQGNQQFGAQQPQPVQQYGNSNQNQPAQQYANMQQNQYNASNQYPSQANSQQSSQPNSKGSQQYSQFNQPQQQGSYQQPSAQATFQKPHSGYPSQPQQVQQNYSQQTSTYPHSQPGYPQAQPQAQSYPQQQSQTNYPQQQSSGYPQQQPQGSYQQPQHQGGYQQGGYQQPGYPRY